MLHHPMAHTNVRKTRKVFLPEIASKVGHDVGVFTILHHQNLLLDNGKVLPWREHGDATLTDGGKDDAFASRGD